MLSFRLAGIPVTVRASFLLVAVLIGLSGGEPILVAAWVCVVFVSILIHELGHALTARSMGAEVAIELNAIGGLTTWSGVEGDLTPGRRALIAAAGSGVGLVFGGAVWLFDQLTGPYAGLGGFVVRNLIWVNVFWGLLNWLPIRPLDGGHLVRSLLQKVVPGSAGKVANALFFLTSATALVLAIRFRLFLVALIAAWLVMGELTRGRSHPAPRLPPMSFDPPREPEPPRDPGAGPG